MALQIRRGTEAQRAVLTGVAGELLYTTDTKKLYVGDGVTAGGTEVAIDLTAPGAIGSVTASTGAFTTVSLTNRLTFATGANIASATTTDISGSTGNIIHITGTTTITAFTMASGQIQEIIFDGILQLTHHATTNKLLTSANITTAAGDMATYHYDGTTVRMIDYARLDGTPINPTLVQVVNVISTGVTSGTALIPVDDTIPQSSEGFQVMTLAITPKATSNNLLIQVVVNLANTAAGNNLVAALFQDSTAGALAAGVQFKAGQNDTTQIVFNHFMTAGTVSATTFKVRVGGALAGTTAFNGEGASRILGGVLASSITITEVSA